MGATNWSIPVGIFSTADLLLEDVLVWSRRSSARRDELR